MSTLVTPSAKSHERVTGRWNQEIKAQTKQDWSSYYIKQVAGTPLPWLISVFLFLSFVSPLVNDITAWICALLASIYILADRFSGTKEFSLFPIGVDLAIGAFIFVLTLNALFIGHGGLLALFNFKWLLLPYFFAYLLELFPGLNGMFQILFGASLLASLYAFIQHFVGVEWISSRNLEFAPLKEFSYFCIQGFSQYPEVFASLIAMILPLPICCYLSAERRNSKVLRTISLLLSFTLMLVIFWTYRPGLWIASLGGVLICLIIHSQRQIKFILGSILFFTCVVLIAYQSPSQFWHQMKDRESLRAAVEREHINELFAQFAQNPILGIGIQSGPNFNQNFAAPDSEMKSPKELETNVYFELLAQIGFIGTFAYFAMILPFLLFSYRLFKEIPASHYWHRVLAAAIAAGQVSFHLSGLYWSTISHSSLTNLFAFYMAVVAYLHHHYMKGLVPDDHSL